MRSMLKLSLRLGILGAIAYGIVTFLRSRQESAPAPSWSSTPFPPAKVPDHSPRTTSAVPDPEAPKAPAPKAIEPAAAAPVEPVPVQKAAPVKKAPAKKAAPAAKKAEEPVEKKAAPAKKAAKKTTKKDPPTS